MSRNFFRSGRIPAPTIKVVASYFCKFYSGFLVDENIQTILLPLKLKKPLSDI